jgi:site-specific DNA recombinase
LTWQLVTLGFPKWSIYYRSTVFTPRAGTLTAAERIDPDKVAIYIRWSTEDQGQGTTLETQEEGCRHYILSQGWRVNPALIFVDDGYTGSNLERPAMAELRKSVRAGRVDCVVVFKLDRLSRSVLDTVNLVLHEWKGKCHVKSARELIDTTTPQGRMIFYVLVSFAEHERDIIRERMYSGRVRRATQGRNPGRMIPYGFRKGEASGQVVVDPDKAAVVRRIFQEYLTGDGIRTIARRLNGEGGYGRQWDISGLQKILDCPLYKGVLEWGARAMTRGEDGKVRAVKRDKPTVTGVPFVTVMPDGTPAGPIVEPELWERVAQARQQRATPGNQNTRAASSPYLLTGLAKCHCGYALISLKRNRGDFYRCSRKHSGGECDFKDVRQDVLDAQVVEYVQSLLPKAGVRERILRKGSLEAVTAIEEAQAAAKLAREQLKSLEEQEKRISRDYRTGGLSIDEYRGFKRELEKDRQGLQQALAKAEQTLEHLGYLQSLQEDWKALLEQMDSFDQLTRPEQKQILRKFVKRLQVIHRGDGAPKAVADVVEFEGIEQVG